MINFDNYAIENNGLAFKKVQELHSHNLKSLYSRSSMQNINNGVQDLEKQMHY